MTIDGILRGNTQLQAHNMTSGIGTSCLDPVSHNSNEINLNGNSRHSSSGLTISERASQLFQNAEICAPMVRASTTPLRSLALSYGCDLVYSEEIIDRAITTSTERVYNEALGTIDYRKKIESFSAKVQRRMAKNGDPLPTIIRIHPKLEQNRLIYQMGTGESNLALPAAQMVHNDVDGIDINMGCPKKFSVSGGMGSALLDDLPRACDIISTLRRNLSAVISCKIRLLEDDRKTVDFVTALVNAGACAVAIHAREVGDESQQAAKLDRLVEVVQLLKSSSSIGVPIIINGDMYTRNDMVNLRNRCGADAVMLARPALYNTSIFIKPPKSENLEGSGEEETRYGYDSKLLKSKTEVVQDYLKHATRYEGHAKNVKYVICEMMTNRRTPTNLSPLMPIKFSGGQTIDDVCKCKTLESLCKIWDVSRSAIVTNDEKTKESVGAVDMHTYDDRYFLDPDAFRKERESKEADIAGQIEKESSCGNKSKADEEGARIAKKSRLA
jgi:tRNA-dihydrouridine synthase 2